MKKVLLVAGLIFSFIIAGPSYAVPLYFPHVDTTTGWQTEIAIINASDQTVSGTLRGLSNAGQPVETKPVALSARGRRQIVVADEFTNHTNIGYIIYDADSDAVQGYVKYYKQGKYRVAIPAVKEVNTSDIYITHIDSGIQWWTGLSLVNTTSAAKTITITFNTGEIRTITLNANEHKPLLISSLFNDQKTPAIQSAVITNASGIIGLEVFGTYDDKQLEGILLTDKTASTLYYPHVAGTGWWTGIVAYNPSAAASTITITPYNAQGSALSPSSLSIPGRSKYVGFVSNLGLPAQTAWFKIDSTGPLNGFELIGTSDYELLAGYAGTGGTGAKAGVFPKIEKNGGGTIIYLVNTEADAATVTLTSYTDAGAVAATDVIPIGGHAKYSSNVAASSATYLAFSSDRNVVGLQLNRSVDGTMLDGLPALDGGGKSDSLSGIRILDAHAHPDRFHNPNSTVIDNSSTLAAIIAMNMAASSFAAVGDAKFQYSGISGQDEYTNTLTQLNRALTLNNAGMVKLVRTTADIPLASGSGVLPGMLLAVEGGDALMGDVSRCDSLYATGVRMITLVHYRNNELGDIMYPMQGRDPGKYNGGLTETGRRAVERMQSLGIVVDLAHASNATLRDVVAMTAKPLIDSHTSLYPGANTGGPTRLRTLEEMQLIAQTGGVVCLWPLATNTRQTFSDWAAEILAIKQHIGIEHVGLGTDGGGALPAMITGYTGISDLGSLADAMLNTGLTQQDLAAFFGGNLLRVLRECID
jgi:membrane dipeptidase